MRRAADIERDGLGLLDDGAGRQHHPRHFLSRGIACAGALHFDRTHRCADDFGLGLGIGGECEDRRGIAQNAAIIGTPCATAGILDILAELFDGRGKGQVSAITVSQHREGRCHLGAGKWRTEIVELGIGEVLQVANWSPAGAGQNIERIGHVLAAAFLDVRRVAHHVADIVDAVHQHVFRNFVALLTSPEQEVGDK